MTPTTMRIEPPPIDCDEAIARHDRRVVGALLARGVRAERAKELAQEAWTRLIQKHKEGALTEVKLPGLAIKQALFLAKTDARQTQRRPQSELPDELGDGRQ